MVRLTQHELSEDPHDVIANRILGYTHGLTGSAVTFAALYLLVHGIVKIVLVAALLRNQAWAYPWMIGFLVIFIGYQLYRLALSPTFWARRAHHLRRADGLADLERVAQTEPPTVPSASGTKRHPRHPPLEPPGRSGQFIMTTSAATSLRQLAGGPGSRRRGRGYVARLEMARGAAGQSAPGYIPGGSAMRASRIWTYAAALTLAVGTSAFAGASSASSASGPRRWRVRPDMWR